MAGEKIYEIDLGVGPPRFAPDYSTFRNYGRDSMWLGSLNLLQIYPCIQLNFQNYILLEFFKPFHNTSFLARYYRSVDVASY
jgi:hypothetical protein